MFLYMGADEPLYAFSLFLPSIINQLGYRATDKPAPRGELCMRGGQRFVGYYKGWCWVRYRVL